MNKRLMHNVFLLVLFFCLPTVAVFAQEYNYNEKGDQAFLRKDYREAKMWFEEGVAHCDKYSIEKLTEIWMQNQQLRPSMRSLMSKCLNCLNESATTNDTTAIKQLINYYTNGIGTSASHDLTDYWTRTLGEIRAQQERRLNAEQNKTTTPTKRVWNTLISYNYSMSMPVGATLGVMNDSYGFYLRYQTNLNTQKGALAATNDGLVGYDDESYYIFNDEQTANYAVTAGFIKSITPWLYASLGAGYGEHRLLWKYQTFDYQTNKMITEDWAYHRDALNRGIAANADLMFKHKMFFLSIGASTINFKNIDANAGLGIVF